MSRINVGNENENISVASFAAKYTYECTAVFVSLSCIGTICLDLGKSVDVSWLCQICSIDNNFSL